MGRFPVDKCGRHQTIFRLDTNPLHLDQFIPTASAIRSPICGAAAKIGRDRARGMGSRPARMQKLPILLLFAALAPLHASVEGALKTLTAIGREGRGNEAATAAWQQLAKAGPPALLPILGATGGGNPVADNWLRLAGDVLVENARKDHAALPLAEVEAFLKDTKHADAARRLAFDLLQKADPKRADAIEPTLIADPVQELRRGAVQRLIATARTQQGEAAKATFQAALDAARDEDQVKLLADELKRLGVAVDLARHFGFLMQWCVIGPFDNTDRKGFDTVFPPEQKIELQASYPGKGKEVKWQEFTSADELGKIDLNKPLTMLKESTAYAVATFESTTERDAELRLGCKNAWKIWLNGELLFGRDEYHRGQQMDQYKLKCHLRKGVNTILVKACQNEQKEEWTVEWEFQLRVCDSTGTAILAEAK